MNSNEHETRVRARRWLLVAAAIFLTWPLIGAVQLPWRVALGDYPYILPIALSLLWAARTSQDRRFRSAILTRAIAAANLPLALVGVLTGVDAWCIAAVVVGVALGRSLQLLGERDLDSSHDPDSSFEPMQFRGLLTLALMMACADILVLSSSALSIITLLPWYGSEWATRMWLPHLGFSVAGAALMAINVWGLLRLRTWALFSGMITNVAIGILALNGMLAGGPLVLISLMVTAAIQLLLPLPLLAVALGFGKARQYDRISTILLRVVVPATVLATIVAAAIHFAATARAW